MIDTVDRAIDSGLFEILWHIATDTDRRACRCDTPPHFDICGLCDDAADNIEALLDGEPCPPGTPRTRWDRMVRAARERTIA